MVGATAASDPGNARRSVESPIGRSVLSRGTGESAPLGVAVEGRAEEAVVIIKGLMSGMELSTGSAVGGDAWQLPATGLHYAWIAPPGGFVGSAILVVELRSSHDRLIDCQFMQLEWTTAVSTMPAQRELNRDETAQAQLDRQEIKEVRATSPAVAQSSLDQEHMIEVPAITQRTIYPEGPTVTAPAQQVAPEEVTRPVNRGKDNFGIVRSSAKDRHGDDLPSAPARVGDNPHAPKGFWDWSR
jgi:hypothetical protein